MMIRRFRYVGVLALASAICLVAGAPAASASTIVNTIAVGTAPIAISSDGSHVWVANYADGTVTEIDAATGTVVNTIPVGSNPSAVSSDGTHVWVTRLFSNTVTEIDASTGTVVNTILVGSGPEGVSSDGTHVWVTNSNDNTVTELNASDGSLVQTIPVGSRPEGISSDGTHVWVVNTSDSTVTEIDASAGTVVNTIPVDTDPFGVSSDGTDVWVTGSNDNTVSELNASDGSSVGLIENLGSRPEGISSDGTDVWVANYSGDTVSEIAISWAPQTITFGTLANQVYGDPPFTVSATASSGLSVSFSSDTPGVCTVAGSTVTIVAAGTCTIDASQAGSAGYLPAPDVTQSFTVSQASQTISFTAPATGVAGGSATLTAAGGASGNPVTFSVDNSSGAGVCTVSGDTLSYTAPGSCVIDANQAGSTDYTAAPQVIQSVTVNQAPAVTSPASTTTGMRAPFDFTVTTTGIPTAAITESGVLPPGVTFTDNGDGTASLAGTAATGTAGSYPITITSSNGAGAPASQAFTLTVTTAASGPAITSDSADIETFGVPFTFTVTTTGYPAPKITKTGALPAGVTFADNGDGTATISGTPARSAVGAYTLTLTAKNSAGTATQTLTLTITKGPVIKKIPTTTAHVGVALTLTITASGYTTPAITQTGTLPSGLSFTDNGNGTATITGTPAVGSGGSYPITITATNQLGTATQTFTLKVDQAPAITSPGTASAATGSAFSFQVTTTGFPAPKITEAGSLPAGVSFKAATGTFSGTPKAGTSGSYPITITATSNSGTVTQDFTLTVS